MWPAWFRKCRHICLVIWSIVVIVYNNIIQAMPTRRSSNNKQCQPGFYRSRFLSGGCTSCNGISSCENEEFEDKQGCLDACSELPINLTTTVAGVKVTSAATKPTRSSSTRKSFQDLRSSSDPSSGIATEQRATEHEKERIPVNPTNDKMASHQSYHNIIIIGIVCTIGGLLVLILFGLLWLKCRSESSANQTASSKSPYIPVSRVSNTDSNEDVQDAEKEVNVDEKALQFSSESELDKLPETNV